MLWREASHKTWHRGKNQNEKAGDGDVRRNHPKPADFFGWFRCAKNGYMVKRHLRGGGDGADYFME